MPPPRLPLRLRLLPPLPERERPPRRDAMAAAAEEEGGGRVT